MRRRTAQDERRDILKQTMAAGGALLLTGVLGACGSRGGADNKQEVTKVKDDGGKDKGEKGKGEKDQGGAEAEVSPVEDLMREHGVLERILLIYEEAADRLELEAELDLKLVSQGAGLVQRFIEGYHEKLEEEHLFPRFRTAGIEEALVQVLQDQHDAGRRLTRRVLELAGATALKEDPMRLLIDDLRQFSRMYRPHAAREDTVLFPALRRIVSRSEYDALGEAFEKKERELFGEEGFEGVVGQVAEIEKALGIHDLAQFTP